MTYRVPVTLQEEVSTGKLYKSGSNNEVALSIIDEYTTSDTWTKDTSARFVLVELWGPGGGGGNHTGNSSGNQACGGGGGEYISYLFAAADAPASSTVTIGAAGTGGANGGINSGSDGGNTELSGFPFALVARGGLGGHGGADATLAVALPPGSATARVVLADAGPNIPISQAGRGGADNVTAPDNEGGSSIYGGGGGGGANGGGAGGTSALAGDGGDGNASAATKGGDGSDPSGGGGGSRSDGGGGDGGAGKVRITQW